MDDNKFKEISDKFDKCKIEIDKTKNKFLLLKDKNMNKEAVAEEHHYYILLRDMELLKRKLLIEQLKSSDVLIHRLNKIIELEEKKEKY